MTVNLLGIQLIDFTPPNSTERIHGCKLWFVREPLNNEVGRWLHAFVGYRWIDSNDKFYNTAIALKPGVTEFTFETDGNHTFLTDIQQ